MCLDAITHRFKPNKQIKTVYKGFNFHGNEMMFPCNPHRNDYAVARGKWLAAECLILETEGAGEVEEYLGGFHCYTSNRPLFNWGERLVRVKVRGLICIGRQDGSTVIVAKEMFVPSPNKKKRKRA